jgi:prepilin signal peptidase PulO-like enzyme (type II secretory pathway)
MGIEMMGLEISGVWFWGILAGLIYLISFIGVIAILVLDYKYSKYPDVYNYLKILLLGLIPIYNTIIVLDMIRLAMVAFIESLHHKLSTSTDEDIDERKDTIHKHYEHKYYNLFSKDNQSMYPSDMKQPDDTTDDKNKDK